MIDFDDNKILSNNDSNMYFKDGCWISWMLKMKKLFMKEFSQRS